MIARGGSQSSHPGSHNLDWQRSQHRPASLPSVTQVLLIGHQPPEHALRQAGSPTISSQPQVQLASKQQ